MGCVVRDVQEVGLVVGLVDKANCLVGESVGEVPVERNRLAVVVQGRLVVLPELYLGIDDEVVVSAT